MEGRAVGHNFERDPPKDHPCQVWFNLVQGFQRRRFKCESLRRTTDAKWWQKLTLPGELKKYIQNVSNLVSGWLLFNANSAFFQLYHGENKLIFNEMLIMSAFCQTNKLSWIFLVLAHWNKSPRIDMSCRHTRTHYPDSGPTSLCSFSLMLRA
jgi:hypothetical protein